MHICFQYKIGDCFREKEINCICLSLRISSLFTFFYGVSFIDCKPCCKTHRLINWRGENCFFRSIPFLFLSIFLLFNWTCTVHGALNCSANPFSIAAIYFLIKVLFDINVDPFLFVREIERVMAFIVYGILESFLVFV